MTLIVEMQEVGSVDEDVLAFQSPDDEGGDMLATSGSSRGGIVRSVIVPALAMSAATLGSIAIASTLRRGSPWSGIQALASGLGLASGRPSDRFHKSTAGASLALVVGGSLVLAQLERMIAPRIGGGVLRRAAFTALTGFAIDRFFLRGTMMPALDRSVGRGGKIAKYALMGLAGALARRVKARAPAI